MITRRTIGYQEKAPNTISIGSRNNSLDIPPRRTQVSSLCGRKPRPATTNGARFAGAGWVCSRFGVVGMIVVDIVPSGPAAGGRVVTLHQRDHLGPIEPGLLRSLLN